MAIPADTLCCFVIVVPMVVIGFRQTGELTPLRAIVSHGGRPTATEGQDAFVDRGLFFGLEDALLLQLQRVTQRAARCLFGPIPDEGLRSRPRHPVPIRNS